MASSSDEQQQQQQQQPRDEQQQQQQPASSETIFHKTKIIQFCGRSTPIILQHDNGPCPLLAICNVLLLRNQLNLSADISEVSQEKLLSLVAERLLDSNSNTNDKDAEYVKNQQQNIADAINLLPQLRTGIDVNVKFCRIDDFEFTPACAIFDLLDIPLYHGWLVDPEDYETAKAIGSKSYNTLMGELVSLEARKMENVAKDKCDEDCIDFAAATTAALGVPSPSLSRAKSFEESPRAASDQETFRIGDAEEEELLRRVLKLSENDLLSDVEAISSEAVSSDDNVHMLKSTPVNSVPSEGHSSSGPLDVEPSVSGCDDVHGHSDRIFPLYEEQAVSLTLTDVWEKHGDQLLPVQLGEVSLSDDLAECNPVTPILNETIPSTLAEYKVDDHEVGNLSTPLIESTKGLHKQNVEQNPGLIADRADSEPSSGRISNIEAVESFTSSLEGSEPLYEGEECILDTGKTVCGDREPVYEGEMVLAELADKRVKDACDTSPKEEITTRQGELINNFLNGNAQLTFHGLFRLQAGLKERELCVFFRNNHFSTMFKLDGELYLLATDQGYMNQPDLVWEKLNEVNGDNQFMTSNFKEFKLESSSNGTWDQQNAVSSTADYLATIDSSATDGLNMNSDLQLAIALQQQEFEQQQQQQQPRNPPQQASGIGSSRLITGPQVPRSSAKATSSTPKQDPKSKDKSNCKIM